MKQLNHNIRPYIWLLLLLFAVAILLFSCNPAKQILSKKEQFDKIGQLWAKEHPCVNDTIVKHNSDTIIDLHTDYDTVYNYSTDTVPIILSPKVITKTVIKTLTVHDSVFIADKRKEAVLIDENNKCTISNALKDAQISSLKNQKLFAQLSFYGLLLAIILGAIAYFYIKRKVK